MPAFPKEIFAWEYIMLDLEVLLEILNSEIKQENLHRSNNVRPHDKPTRSSYLKKFTGRRWK